MTALVFVDSASPAGRIADPQQPQLSVLDQGVTRGDGIFETAHYRAGAVRKLDAHLSRMQASAAALEIKLPSEEALRGAVDTAVAEFLKDYDDAAQATLEAAVKIVVTRGGEDADHGVAWVMVSALSASLLEQREKGIDVILLDRGYDSTVADRAPWLLMGAKTLSYAVNMAALRHAHHQGADDVIFTSTDGLVLEGPTSSVLIASTVDGVKTLTTPILETGILPGTTQGAIFAAAEKAGWDLGYGPLEPHHLMEADAVWLVSSVRLLAPINSIDGTKISRDAELHRDLQELVDQIM
ncbi:aminodeoxychorismate lyase [Neomicrococcus lactis]|uniref:4-amino-4-deoxychorismate lyase n=1 Tax=Neomicrococcus lactis TaxID=732241 RepID=A0A7W9DC84_9MICC|nr:aminodeoxychorismate lyase [Neomicrococcus lactis]MBB5599269.1 4-amino-4-deoxychorismate lyase [Neomicrococcus lactis]